MVSGGINLEQLADYLRLPVRAICLGSALTPKAFIDRADWGALTSLAQKYVEFAAAWEAAATGNTHHGVAPARGPVPDTVFAPVRPSAAAYQPPPTPHSPSQGKNGNAAGEEWIR
jgi:hypothetical protein